VVRTRIQVAGGGDRFTFGSGYLVAPGRVLTAAHVLVAPREDPPARKGQTCEVLCSGADEVWLPAEVLWVEAAFDLAVVGVEAGSGLAPLRWGRVEGDEPLMWSAVGYPVASLDEGGRQPEHAWGETSAITQAPAEKLGLTVNSRHARLSATTSGWAGLSGAAVFCDRRLVGVVIADPSGYEGSLVARRLEAVADDRSLHEALGGWVVFEPVSGRALEPGLRDLRVLLPDPIASFTGRADELAWLAQARTGPVVVTQAIAGLGGVGKTALALQYAHRSFYSEHSVDLAWWFVAADRLSLSAAMARLYEQLTGLPGGEDSVLAAARLRNWLESSPYRWLIVFDNADLLGVIDGLVPHAGEGQVLITSRRSDWSLLGVTVRRLDVLPPEDAVALLRRITGRDDDEGARQLAQELDGLAVALQQAGAFLRKTGWDYQRYLEMLRSHTLSLLSEDLAGVGMTVAKVWESSLDKVIHSGRTLAGDVLGVLAYFAAEDIPRWLLAPPALDAEESVAPGDPLAVDLALVGLADYSLINLEADAISLHRLVQHLTRVHVEGSGAASDHVATAIRLLVASVAEPGSGTARISRLLSHITEATEHAARLSAVPEETTSLLNAVAEDRLRVGQLDIARPLLDRALGIAIHRLGPDHPETLKTRTNLARWFDEAGRVDEAITLSQALLEDHRRVLGPDHPDTLTTRSDLARFLGEAGRADEAVAQFQALLEDQHRVLGPDHPDTLTTRNNLACRLALAGKVDEAVAQSQALLEDDRRVLGPDHPTTLWTRRDLARWLGEAGKVDEAVAQSQALLEDHRRVLGPDHPDTLNARTNLARFIGEAGRADEAVAQFQALLEDHRRVLGPDHPDTLQIRRDLARWLGEAGRADEAVAQFQVLLKDDLRVLGPDHPYTLRTRRDLARFLGEAGRADEALAQFQVLLEDDLRVLGPDHPDTLTSRGNLARWLGEVGKVDDAVAQFQALLEDDLRVLGPDHPDTLTSRNNLAFWFGEAGRAEDAVAHVRALVEDHGRVLGPDHPDALTSRNNLAFYLGKAGRVDEAVAESKALLEDRRRVLGPDHPDTLRTRGNLIQWLGESGRVDEAVAESQALLEDRRRVLGPNHPDTFTIRYNLAYWLGEAGRVDEAVAQFQTLLVDRRRVLGPEHPDTLRTQNNLASFLREEAGEIDDVDST
jgi:tetratricopeptide (TPR) repeat protein